MWTKEPLKNLNPNNSFTLKTMTSLRKKKSPQRPQSQKTNGKLGENICNSYRQRTVSLIYKKPLEFNKKRQTTKEKWTKVTNRHFT